MLGFAVDLLLLLPLYPLLISIVILDKFALDKFVIYLHNL